MSHILIITKEDPIYQFLLQLNFKLFFTKPVFKHILEFITASVSKGYKGKITDIVLLSIASCHRTTFGKFLSQGVWNIHYAWRTIRKKVIDIIYDCSETSKTPIFAIYDDTIAEKTMPSLRAKNTIQATGFHKSHLKGKQVWGHQLLTMMLSCEYKVLPYCIERYTKNGKSKIERVCEMASTLPIPDGTAYCLCDSWYTNEKVINAHIKRGYHLIGALKTNRIIYPKGIHIQIKDFAKYIEKNDVHLVTVNNSKYWVYRYEGSLNGIENAVVLLTWSKNAFKKDKALHAFLCTDVNLDNQTILEYYSKRWPIEVFFKETKNNLGLDKYQVRSTKSIDRMLLLITLTYFYCTMGTGSYCNFSQGLKSARKETLQNKALWIYQCAKDDISIDNIFKQLKIA